MGKSKKHQDHLPKIKGGSGQKVLAGGESPSDETAPSTGGLSLSAKPSHAVKRALREARLNHMYLVL